MRHAGSSARGNFGLKHTGGSGAGEGFLLGGSAATPGSALLCARGRHEHVPTAGVRRGKGHEEPESQHREIPSRIPSWERDRAGSQSQAQARPSVGITLIFCHIALNAAWWE